MPCYWTLRPASFGSPSLPRFVSSLLFIGFSAITCSIIISFSLLHSLCFVLTIPLGFQHRTHSSWRHRCRVTAADCTACSFCRIFFFAVSYFHLLVFHSYLVSNSPLTPPAFLLTRLHTLATYLPLVFSLIFHPSPPLYSSSQRLLCVHPICMIAVSSSMLQYSRFTD